MDIGCTKAFLLLPTNRTQCVKKTTERNLLRVKKFGASRRSQTT